MIIRRISQAAIGLLLLIPSYLLALNLGDITLNSSLYQPLQATIPITDSQSVDMSTVRATLGSEAQFKQAGLKRSETVQQLQFAVKADAQGKAWISVTSKQAIVDSSLQFIVRLSWPYGETMRWYTLKLASSSTSSPDVVAKMKADALADAAATTVSAQKKAAAQAQVSTLMTQQLEQINTHLQTVQVSLSSLQQTNEMLKSQLDSQNQAMQQLQQQVTTLQTQQAAAPVAPAPVATPAVAPAKAATPAASAPEEEQGYRLKTWQAFLAAFVILFIILRMVAVLRRQSAQAVAAPGVPGQPLAPADGAQAVAAAPTTGAPVQQAPGAPAGIKPTVVMPAGQPNVPEAPPKPRVVPITELRKAKATDAQTAPGKNPLVAPLAPIVPQTPAPVQNDGPRPQLSAAAKGVPMPSRPQPSVKPGTNVSAPLVKPIEEKKIQPVEKPAIVTPTPGDNEYSNSTVENRHATQLDLAQAYISMGDYSAAKKLLKEVIAKADGKHKKEAQQLLEKIPAKKGK